MSRGPSRGLAVSLDGPGSSGKSSVGAAAARILGYRYCDTGLLYRTLTWIALERGVPLDDGVALGARAVEVQLASDQHGGLTRASVDGVDVTEQVHSSAVDRHVSQVAQHAPVRDALLSLQREIAASGAIIMAGRDIGTVILPHADLKLWLEVSIEERARRRAHERRVDLASPEGQRILRDLARRDELDRARPIAPLRVPEGARIIRTDGNTLDQTVTEVVALIRETEREHLEKEHRERDTGTGD